MELSGSRKEAAACFIKQRMNPYLHDILNHHRAEVPGTDLSFMLLTADNTINSCERNAIKEEEQCVQDLEFRTVCHQDKVPESA